MKTTLQKLLLLTVIGCNLPLAASAYWFDDFESYSIGSNLHGQGGWAGWGGAASAGALVSGSYSFSPTRSLAITGASDLVHTFSSATNGNWVFTVQQYIPSTASGTNYVVLLNTYRPPYGANDLNWSVQIQNDMDAGHVISDFGGGATLPMVKDQWVEIQCVINLTSNTVSEFYNGQLLSTHAWQGTFGVPGLNEIQALDLFANNAGPAFYDNVSLTGGTAPVILQPPLGLMVTQGLSATFTVTASGAQPLQYNWIFCPRPFWDVTLPPILLAATGPTLTLSNVQSVDGGDYLAVVSNASGSVTSAVARLTFVPNKNCLLFAGREHCPTGGAGMNSYSKSLFISNIGSSGEDGVTVELIRAAAWEAHWMPLDPTDSLPVGAYVQSQVFGTADSVNNGLLGSWRETKEGTSNYVVTADFSPIGASNVTVQVYSGTNLVASTNGQSGALCRIYGCVDDDHWGRPVPAGGPFGGGLTMFGPTAIMLQGGTIVQGDRLVILPEGASLVSSLSAVKVMASQIPQIVITNERIAEIAVPMWTYVGIKSYVCVLFGACDIVLDAPTAAASARSIPTLATWIHGRLQLDFLAEPPDKTNVFVISQDIVLSSDTAQALGHQQVTVHAGAYPMDFSVNPHGQVSPDVTVQGLVIGVTITIGRNRYNCNRFGFCTLDEVTVDLDLSARPRSIPGGLSWTNGHLLVNFLAEPPDKTNVLTIDDDIVLNTVLAQSLGYQHLTLLAGDYPVDYSVNPHGQVSPNVAPADIVIGGTFTIGRNRYNCRKFGICTVDEITIDLDLSPDRRAIPGGLSWVNGSLMVNFLAEPPDKTNVLVIDDDIALSTALAQSLGQPHVTLRAGEYPLDYSVNPHGQFSPNIGTILLKVGQNSDGTISLIWPVTTSSIGLVEAADFVGPSTIWKPVTNAPTTVDGNNLVKLPRQNPHRFYRLETPH